MEIVKWGVDIGTIFVSVLSSGITSTILTYWLNSRKAQRDFLRTKLEELFVARQGFKNFLRDALWLPMLSVMGGTPYEQAFKYANALGSIEPPKHFETCVMLVRLYFTEFLDAWDRLMECRKAVNSIFVEFERLYQSHADTGVLENRLNEAMKDFQKQDEALVKLLMDKAQKLMPEKPFWERHSN